MISSTQSRAAPISEDAALQTETCSESRGSFTVEDLLAAVEFRPRRLAFPDPWVGHIPFAAWLVRKFRPAVFVELGTHAGNSYFAFCQAVMETRCETRCFAVDSWKGDEHAGLFGEEVFEDVNAYNDLNYAAFSSLVRSSFDDAQPCFGDASIDLLHIDGLHTYDAVRRDFEKWLPKLAADAVVIFHDISVRERGFGVWRLWAELKESYSQHIEFAHSHGLGVLQLGDGGGDRALDFLAAGAGAPDRARLTQFFARLGENCLLDYKARCVIDPLKAEIDRKDAALSALALEQATLVDEIRERDGAIQRHNAELARLAVEIRERESALDRLTADRDRLAAKADEYVYHLEKIKSLLPWKIYEFIVQAARSGARLFRVPDAGAKNRALEAAPPPAQSEGRARPGGGDWRAEKEHVALFAGAPLREKQAKLICFYLPQFHAISENNAWWGEGFTEWTNVRAAQPQFEGHYQPRVPGDLGYYNLLDPDVLRRQIELARLYGVEGFCFYAYWFGGKRLLETPDRNLSERPHARFAVLPLLGQRELDPALGWSR